MVSKATPRHERRVFWLALLGGVPAVALALGLLWFGDFAPRTQWTLTLLVAGVWLASAAIVREHVMRPLQTVSNVLAALRGLLLQMFPDRPLTAREQVRIGEGRAKSIFLHHYMDRHDFDLERLRKCCHHYPQADGRVMPACGFNMFHRGAAKGPDTAIAQLAQPAGRALRVVQGM